MKRTTMTIMAILALTGCREKIQNTDTPEKTEEATVVLTVSASSDILYPEEQEYTYNIVSDRPLGEFDIEVQSELTVSTSGVQRTSDKQAQGSFTVTGSSTMPQTATVELTAKGKTWSAAQTVTFEKAYLTIDKTKGGLTDQEGSLTVTVSANVPFTCSLDEEANAFTTMSTNGNEVTVSCRMNEGFEERQGSVTIRDEKGKLAESVFSFSQAGSNGSRYTDSLALVQFWHDCGGEKFWEPNGGSPYDKYDFWNTEKQLERWCGVYTTSSYLPALEGNNWNERGTEGRVIRLGMNLILSDRKDSCGVLSPAIGNLTQLQEIDFLVDNLTGGIPENWKNLKKLIKIDIDGDLCHLNFKLEDCVAIREWIKSGKLKRLFLYTTDIWGPIPEWLADYNGPNPAGICLCAMGRISGRIPDRVMESSLMTIRDIEVWDDLANMLYPDYMDSKYLRAASLCLSVAERNLYAIWYDVEKPDAVHFVEDEHDGHWEWNSLQDAVDFVMSHI